MSASRRARISRWLVLGFAVAILSSPGGAASSAVAALCAVAAAALAEKLAGDSFGGATLWLPGVCLAAATLGVAGLALARLAADSTGLAVALGPAAAIHLSEALLWVSASAPVVFALRFTARRHPVAGVAEVVGVAGCFVGALAAHRHGLISRPFLLGDWSWQIGIDPTLALLGLGGGAALLLAVLLVGDETAGRSGVYLSALIVVALALIAVLRLDALPRPDPPGAGEAEREKQTASGGGQDEREDRSRGASSRDWDFRNDLDSDADEAPVAVVILHDDYQPNSGAYYFRQSALSQFNGRRLVQATRDDVDRDVLRYFPTGQVWLPEAPEPSGERMPLRTTTGLLVDHVRPFALDSPAVFEPATHGGSARFQRTYAALSLVQTVPYRDLLGRLPGHRDWTPAQREHYTVAPSDPRYLDLAQDILQRLAEPHREDPMAQALAVKLYLDENGVYSFANRHADASDPTASFLFGDLTGYCVHFAHAATFLLRSLGVPARVATGYAVPAPEGYGGSAILIRALNAHAWPEIHLDGLGWVVIDLVPERSDVASAPPIDPELQRMLGELLREKSDAERVTDGVAEAGGSLADLLRPLLALLVATVVAGYGVRVHRLLAPRFASPGHSARVAYRAALDRLAGVGFRRRYGESREQFARRARDLAPSFVPLTGAHLRASLGPTARHDRRALRELAGRVGAEIRAGVPSWRRALAALDPFCWMRVH